MPLFEIYCIKKNLLFKKQLSNSDCGEEIERTIRKNRPMKRKLSISDSEQEFEIQTKKHKPNDFLFEENKTNTEVDLFNHPVTEIFEGKQFINEEPHMVTVGKF